MSMHELCWPLSRLGEGMEELARRARLNPTAGDALLVPDAATVSIPSELARWIEWAGTRLGIEAEAVDTSVAELSELLRVGGPALLQVWGPEGRSFLLLLKTVSGVPRLIGPDLKIHCCPAEELRAVLCRQYEAPLVGEIDRLLEAAQLPPKRRPQVRAAMLQERLATKRIGACWILRLPASSGFWRQLRQERLPRRLLCMLGLFVVLYVLELAGWGLIGNAALNGRLDFAWMTAWVLLVLSLVPLRLFGGWLDTSFALDAGRILKKHLLAGALRLDIESVRHQGAGQLLSRVMESQALESLAVNGGLSVLVAVLELAFAAWVLGLGAGGYHHLLLLVVWLAVTVWLSLKYVRDMRGWTMMRLDMTHDLVERMVGHRTRLAQEWPYRRDEQDDRIVKDYLNTSKQMDASGAGVVAGIPAGWMLLGFIGLAPAFVSGTATPAGLALGLGGILLANRAFSGISSGLAAMSRAIVSWNQVAPLFHAATGTVSKEPFLTATPLGGGVDEMPAKLIDASNLVFRYRPQGEPVLRGADLSIHHGERILLEGSSGGGKSTLAALLVGLRKPESGLLLLNGLDHHTLGASWHRLATEAPQFHENHILSGTIGFNLLMGRNWPATEEELEEARALCAELGLGDLLERMPSGMMQMVGETGWQLSHGERSRIFLARALLQKSQFTIMDESFAALDPETLKQCLNCAFDRAHTLLVIAHP